MKKYILIVGLALVGSLNAADTSNAQDPEAPLRIHNAPASWKVKKGGFTDSLETPGLIFAQVNRSPDRYMGAAVRLFASGILVTQIGCKNKACFDTLQAKLCADIPDKELQSAREGTIELLLQDKLNACHEQSFVADGDAFSFLWYRKTENDTSTNGDILKLHYLPPSQLGSTTCGTGAMKDFPLIHLCGILKHPAAMDIAIQGGQQLRKKAKKKKFAQIAPLVTDAIKEKDPQAELSFIMVDLEALAATIAKQTKTASKK